jgi:hypothetical protein
MTILGTFRKKGWIDGTVVVHGLPPHKMYCVSVTFFPVSSSSAPPPFGGNPPANQYVDDESVKEADEPDDKLLRFRVQRPVGYYYLAVGVIAYLERDGKMFAQVERFFPMTRPCQIQLASDQLVELTVAWPDIPFEELPSYGIVYPRTR